MRPIYTADLVLMPAEESLAGALCDYFRRNREFLTDYMPAWTESFFTERTQLESIRGHMENAKNRTGYRYYIMPKEEKGKIIGTIGLNNIVWGSFLSCFMGYMLDEVYINRGYMTQAVDAVANTAFNEIGLHRIEANIMPKNARSLRVAEKCGFVREGMSKKISLHKRCLGRPCTHGEAERKHGMNKPKDCGARQSFLCARKSPP